MTYYKLVDKEPVPCTLEEFVSTSKRIALYEQDGLAVSTVFLGINHSFREGPPLLFETMVFGGKYDQHQERCSTYDQAVAQHNSVLFKVLNEEAHDST